MAIPKNERADACLFFSLLFGVVCAVLAAYGRQRSQVSTDPTVYSQQPDPWPWAVMGLLDAGAILFLVVAGALIAAAIYRTGPK